MVSNLFTYIMAASIYILHPFFVSMTEMDYNAKDKELEISVRIFTDDLENTIRKLHPGIKIDILHPNDQAQMNQFVFDYMQKHLQLTINGKPMPMSFVGYEQQSESVWTYLEIKNISALQKINVVNSLLYDYNENEINMMHVNVNGNEQSYKVDYPDTNAEFDF